MIARGIRQQEARNRVCLPSIRNSRPFPEGIQASLLCTRPVEEAKADRSSVSNTQRQGASPGQANAIKSVAGVARASAY